MAGVQGVMNERAAVKVVARLAPWLAPAPSAYFVARSSMEHLALPLLVAIISAAIIETLGLSTVHTWLWLSDYNGSKRKSDPSAPVWMPAALGGVYLLTTIGLVVALEVWPLLATYAPALFPLLAVVGAVNLALIAQQERREAGIQAQKAEARERRKSGRPESRQSLSTRGQVSGNVSIGRTSVRNVSKRDGILDSILDVYRDDPHARPAEISQQLGIGRSTVYGYLAALETAGVISRNGHGVEVLE